MQHSFVDCYIVKQFWGILKIWFKRNFDFVINFGPLDILLGIPNYDSNSDLNVLNFVILFAKSFIKKHRIYGKMFDFYQFQIELKKRVLIEKQILLSNGLLEQFEKRCETLLNSL